MNRYYIVVLVLIFAIACTNEGAMEQENDCDAGTYIVETANEVLLLSTQTEVNEFGEFCYSVIEGNLWIQDHFTTSETDKILDLSPLNSLREIKGELRLKLTEGRSLQGLENINRVDALRITESPELENLIGLDQLNKIGNDTYRETTFYPGSLYIRDCSSLTSLSGLDNLTTVDWLVIYKNENLTSFSGLENLINVKGQTWFPDDELYDITIGWDCFDLPCGPFMYQLNDLCALQNLFTNGNYELDEFYLGENLPFYPTIDDIIAGNCSQ